MNLHLLRPMIWSIVQNVGMPCDTPVPLWWLRVCHAVVFGQVLLGAGVVREIEETETGENDRVRGIVYACRLSARRTDALNVNVQIVKPEIGSLVALLAVRSL